jgi:hypothetical protein
MKKMRFKYVKIPQYLLPTPVIEINNVTVEPGGYIRLSHRATPIEGLKEQPVVQMSNEWVCGYAESIPKKKSKVRVRRGK